MSKSPESPKLQEDAATLGVHCARDLLPSGHLLGRPDTGDAVHAAGLLGDEGRLRDEQATIWILLAYNDYGQGSIELTGSTLIIVIDRNVRGDKCLGIGSETRQWGHDDAMLECRRANLDRREEERLGDSHCE